MTTSRTIQRPSARPSMRCGQSIPAAGNRGRGAALQHDAHVDESGGAHGKQLVEALECADCAIVSNGENPEWLPGTRQSRREILRLEQPDEIISAIKLRLSGNDVIITMSNGDFDGLPGRLAGTISAVS